MRVRQKSESGKERMPMSKLEEADEPQTLVLWAGVTNDVVDELIDVNTALAEQ